MTSTSPAPADRHEVRADRPDARALRPDGTVATCHVVCLFDGYADQRTAYTVRAQGPWDQVEEATGGDAFGALLQVRRQLEPQGWRLALAGARIDLWPSGMLRDCGGEEGYLLTADQDSAPVVVPIFGDAPDELVVTVTEQEAAYRQWLG